MDDEETDWLGYTFEERRAFLKERWDAGAKRGFIRSEEEKLWDELSLELEFSGKPMAELEGIAFYARQWFSTKNPHYIDAAFLQCSEHGIAPPPTLTRLMFEVAATRMVDGVGPGTPKRVRDDAVLGEALRIICGLHLAELPLATAASKAARYVADLQLGKTYKASTLEREYAEKFRSGEPSVEAVLRDKWECMRGEWLETWQQLAKELPEADDDLKGSRR